MKLGRTPAQIPPTVQAQQASGAAPPATVDANWNCSVNTPGPGGVAMAPIEKALTVGEIFVLVCEGDSVNLRQANVRLDLRKDEKYALKILKTQNLGSTKGIFTATTYKVASGEVKGAVLTDGTIRVALNGVNLNVESVIKQEDNPEGKPYSPLDPYALAWPNWIWITFAVVLAVIVLFILNLLQTSAQRKRLMLELTRHGTALTPYQHMNKELRAIGRHYPLSAKAVWEPEQANQFIRDLDQAMRWFLAREFTVPAHEWRSAKTLKAIRKKNKKFPKEILKNLKATLSELDKAREVGGSLTTVDAAQLVEICRRSADLVYSVRKKGAAA